MSRAIAEPAANDIRIGVTPAEHRVLDLLDEMRSDDLPPIIHLAYAKQIIDRDFRFSNDGSTSRLAEQAAAHLMRCAEMCEAYLEAHLTIGGAK